MKEFLTTTFQDHLYREMEKFTDQKLETLKREILEKIIKTLSIQETGYKGPTLEPSETPSNDSFSKEELNEINNMPTLT